MEAAPLVRSLGVEVRCLDRGDDDAGVIPDPPRFQAQVCPGNVLRRDARSGIAALPVPSALDPLPFIPLRWFGRTDMYLKEVLRGTSLWLSTDTPLARPASGWAAGTGAQPSTGRAATVPARPKGLDGSARTGRTPPLNSPSPRSASLARRSRREQRRRELRLAHLGAYGDDVRCLRRGALWLASPHWLRARHLPNPPRVSRPRPRLPRRASSASMQKSSKRHEVWIAGVRGTFSAAEGGVARAPPRW